MTTRAERTGDVITVLPDNRDVHLIMDKGSPAIPGARYHVRADSHHDADHFVVPLSWSSCVALRGAFGDSLQIGPALDEWARAELRDRVVPAMEIRSMHLALTDDHPMREQIDPRLWEPQKVGAAFMAVAGSALNTDDTGGGKTAQTVAALKLLKALPALVIAPGGVKRAWRRQFETWWPECRVAVVPSSKERGGTAKKRRELIERARDGEFDVVVIGWDALRLHTKLAGWGSSVRVDPKEREAKELNEIAWRAVVADEVHRACEPRSKQTRALWAVSKDVPHRFGLTGTPADEATEDMWALGHFVAPDEWPGKSAFIDRYTHSTFNPWGGLEVVGLLPATQDELFKFLDPRMLRRTLREIAPWMPDEPEWVSREVELSPKQRRAYDQMEKSMLAILDSGTALATDPLTQLTRLRQFACAYAELETCPRCGGDLEYVHVKTDGEETKCPRCRGFGTVVRMAEPSCKLDALEEEARDLGNERAVIFAESAQLIRLAGARLEKRGYEIGYHDGAADEQERDDAVQSFRKGDTQFVLLTFAAGGEGVDGLQVCNQGIYLQRSYRRRFQVQSEGRLDRGGQENRVRFIDVTAPGTVDDRVLEVLGEKADVAEEINRDKLREILTRGAER